MDISTTIIDIINNILKLNTGFVQVLSDLKHHCEMLSQFGTTVFILFATQQSKNKTDL